MAQPINALHLLETESLPEGEYRIWFTTEELKLRFYYRLVVNGSFKIWYGNKYHFDLSSIEALKGFIGGVLYASDLPVEIRN